MKAVEYLYHASPWLLLCLECAALFVLVGLSTHLLESSSTPSEPVLLGPDEYQQLWNNWFQWSCLALVGKVLFVIAVFQLGVGLKRLLSPVSTDNHAREI
ncbi:hypothetical protein [Gimesia algae]|uniref:Uncharacterized protein n=1 Tax=Gimesia algae TaxID=2527971 RepID=A0A517V9H0_9PLAN|nr:hypothetical protein [Gimesia algae]QDT89633.1 hypothetical protein Pan161_12650 [Gimesia algae]